MLAFEPCHGCTHRSRKFTEICKHTIYNKWRIKLISQYAQRYPPQALNVIIWKRILELLRDSNTKLFIHYKSSNLTGILFKQILEIDISGLNTLISTYDWKISCGTPPS